MRRRASVSLLSLSLSLSLCVCVCVCVCVTYVYIIYFICYKYYSVNGANFDIIPSFISYSESRTFVPGFRDQRPISRLLELIKVWN